MFIDFGVQNYKKVIMPSILRANNYDFETILLFYSLILRSASWLSQRFYVFIILAYVPGRSV